MKFVQATPILICAATVLALGGCRQETELLPVPVPDEFQDPQQIEPGPRSTREAMRDEQGGPCLASEAEAINEFGRKYIVPNWMLSGTRAWLTTQGALLEHQGAALNYEVTGRSPDEPIWVVGIYIDPARLPHSTGLMIPQMDPPVRGAMFALEANGGLSVGGSYYNDKATDELYALSKLPEPDEPIRCESTPTEPRSAWLGADGHSSGE